MVGRCSCGRNLSTGGNFDGHVDTWEKQTPIAANLNESEKVVNRLSHFLCLMAQRLVVSIISRQPSKPLICLLTEIGPISERVGRYLGIKSASLPCLHMVNYIVVYLHTQKSFAERCIPTLSNIGPICISTSQFF